MKIITGPMAYKDVIYYQYSFQVPEMATHIAADADGEVWWYSSEPVMAGSQLAWTKGHSEQGGIMIVEFDEGEDWRDSLRAV